MMSGKNNKKGPLFWFTLFMMVLIFLISLWKLYPNQLSDYLIRVPIVNSSNNNQIFGVVTCHSTSNYKSLVSGDFLICDFSSRKLNFKKIELWYENYETKEKKEISLGVGGNTIYPPLPIKSAGNTDFFISFYEDYGSSTDYLSFFNERVKSFEEYTKERYQKWSILFAVISLIFIIPTGMKNLREIYYKRRL